MKEQAPKRPHSHTPRQSYLLLLLALIVGVILRLTGLRWGLPNHEHLFSYHPDEIPILGAVAQLNVFTGQFNPHFFNYGTLYIYIVYLFTLIATGFGWIDPKAGLVDQLAGLHLVGRGVSVGFGVATILLTYFLARRVTNKTGAALAAFLIAIVPGHVVNSHYATVDVTLTFWVTLALLLMTHIEATENSRWVFWSGLAVGLAAATKYTAGLLIVPLMFQCWRYKAPTKWPLLACLGAVLGFLIGCPYAVLTFLEFKRDFLFELHHSRTGSGLVFQNTGTGWMYHMRENLPYVLGIPCTIFFALGWLGLLLTDGEADPSRTLLNLWVGLFFGIIGATQVRFLRYLLPLLPPMMVLFADSVEALFCSKASDPVSEQEESDTTWRPGRKALMVSRALTIILVSLLAFSAWNSVCQFPQSDPRDEAAAWLNPQLHSGTTVGLITLPWFYTPPITPFNGGMKSVRQFEAWQATAPYRIIVTGWDVNKLKETNPEYFITSEFETRDELRLKLREPLRFLDYLSKHYTLEKVFKNKGAGRPLLASAFVPHDWLYPNPEIRVYRRKLNP